MDAVRKYHLTTALCGDSDLFSVPEYVTISKRRLIINKLLRGFDRAISNTVRK